LAMLMAMVANLTLLPALLVVCYRKKPQQDWDDVKLSVTGISQINKARPWPKVHSVSLPRPGKIKRHRQGELACRRLLLCKIRKIWSQFQDHYTSTNMRLFSRKTTQGAFVERLRGSLFRLVCVSRQFYGYLHVRARCIWQCV
jgi:hypothetical protein